MSDKLEQYPPDSKEARAQRLRQLRKMAGQPSRKTIERRCGLSASTLRSYEDADGVGLTEQGAKVVVTIYQKLDIDCSVSWLYHGCGQPPKHYVRAVPALKLSEPTNTIEQEINYFKQLHPEGITLECKNDAMLPIYRYGDFVGGIRHYTTALRSLAGRDCIVEIKTGRVLLRRLQLTRSSGHFNLVAINPDTHIEKPVLYSAEILSAAPVIRIWRGKKW